MDYLIDYLVNKTIDRLLIEMDLINKTIDYVALHLDAIETIDECFLRFKIEDKSYIISKYNDYVDNTITKNFNIEDTHMILSTGACILMDISSKSPEYDMISYKLKKLKEDYIAQSLLKLEENISKDDFSKITNIDNVFDED